MTPLRPEPCVVADANVFHSNDQRNVLMTLATERQMDLRWTNEIETEWTRSLVRRMTKKSDEGTGQSEEKAAKHFAAIAALMRKNLPNYDVPDYQEHMAAVPKADAKDRHVAAAAVGCAPSYLITWNPDDFDSDELKNLDVILTDPDTFLCDLFTRKSATVHGSVEKAYGYVRSGHSNRGQTPPTWDQYLDILAQRGAPNALPEFAKLLRAWRPEPSDDPADEADASAGNEDSEDVSRSFGR